MEIYICISKNLISEIALVWLCNHRVIEQNVKLTTIMNNHPDVGNFFLEWYKYYM